ncbi:DUF3298 and DUF4163 domain-containing protein [Bacillus cihuensis]|uniref:DUF3298 and DUF4163 domain-containing protein n=1 Tax=Bacillus cihuensis TaxID=1208599 RepID=UPI00041E04B6|nr:DUF3298 and DUF4163 domain-containing protein [Bacillus cihuensis]
MDKKLEKLKDHYMDIPIPKELDDVVNRALQTSTKKRKVAYKWSIGTVAAAILLIATVNSSPSAANAMSNIPIIGKVIDVITFQEWKEEKDNQASMDIKVPAISGLDNSGLEASLNEKYIAESKQLYQEFTKTLAELKEGENANMAVTSGYEVLTDNDSIFSIRRYNVITQASSSTEMQFDTVDKKNQVLLTLKSLFKNESYIDVLSENIKAQIAEQMKSDPNKIYWVSEDDPVRFEKIDRNQKFYINEQNKLVIAFDQYEVAPGYMGPVEFIIPTDEISDILVGKEYIK